MYTLSGNFPLSLCSTWVLCFSKLIPLNFEDEKGTPAFIRLGNFAVGEGVHTWYLLGEENPQQISTLQVKELPVSFIIEARLVFTVDFKGFGYLISWRGSEAVNHGHACKRSGNWEGFAIPYMPCRGSEAVTHESWLCLQLFDCRCAVIYLYCNMKVKITMIFRI